MKKIIINILNLLFPYKNPSGAMYEFDADGKTWIQRLSDNGQIDRLMVNKIRTN